ncbi:MAG TPA: DUF2304 domain-containing protein [Candidatus Nanopelagicales bacterium]|nr:DUF2304 domain-containing protein [Candidatus Nanopelagicales bacterium]
MSSYVLGIVAALGVSLFVIEMLRRGFLREKFAVLWLLVSAGLVIIAVFPGVLRWAANLVGVQVPSNLLFMMSALLLLVVSVQLSNEVSRVEARTRRLAEEIALLKRSLEERDGQ